MGAMFKDVWSTLVAGVRKDIWFFGPLGALVGWLAVAEYAIGARDADRWSTDLFGDFASPHAFTLVFMVAIGLISALRAIPLEWTQSRALMLGGHMYERLHALAAPAIAFTMGFAIYVAGRAFVNFSLEGLGMIGMLALFDVLLLAGLFMAGVVIRGVDPFGRRLISAFVSLVAVAVFWYTVLERLN